MLPEFERVVVLAGRFFPGDPRCQPGHQWAEDFVNNIVVPKGARTIRAFFAWGLWRDGFFFVFADLDFDIFDFAFGFAFAFGFTAYEGVYS